VIPFQLHYVLARRYRLATELLPWVPAIAATIGFSIGVAVLSAELAPWFLFLLLIPLIIYRGLFALLFDLSVHSGQVVEVSVDDFKLEMLIDRKLKSLPLEGIIQVFKGGNILNVLHVDGTVLIIPVDAISDEQVDYLKSFALQAAAERNRD
jgi:hypothetical protein